MKHKHFSLLILAGIMYSNAFAQPVIKWQKTIGGNGTDVLLALDLTSDNGIIAGGFSNSNKSGEKSENSRGDIDNWIVKLDSKGKIQWDKTIGGNGFDELYSLRKTNDGGYIIGTRSSSNKSGEKSENSKGGEDFWIIKLDGSGNIQWDKTIGGNGSDGTSTVEVFQTMDGGYIAGGSSSSSISGNKTGNSRGGDDYWIVKLDGSGNFQWDKTIGANSNDGYSSMDVQQSKDGGYILAGASDSKKSGEKAENSRGSWDYWIVKLDASGSIQWDKTIGGNGEDRLYHHSLQTTSDGGCAVFGWSASGISGEKTENSRGSHDYWVVKLNKAGNIEWDKTIGGNGSDEDGVVAVCGKNHYLLGGNSGSGISGDKTQKSRGGPDYWIVKLVYNKPADIAASALHASTIKTSDNSSKSFIVYPNPAKNIVTVTYNAPKNSRYIFEITSPDGKVLTHQEINAMQGTNRTDIDVSRFAKGAYFITITRPDKTKESLQLRKE